MEGRMTHAELLELKRWNTPTVYNGWEQITARDSGKDGFNLEPLTDFMPGMGPMTGRAVTLVIEPGNAGHSTARPEAWEQYREYVSSVPGPKIVVVQDLDKPRLYGSFWGEVNANVHKALGCVGCITDGGIRDLDEMCNAGFKALARSLCVGHAYSCPVRWDCEVEVFGRKVRPGELIHADKHGFLAIPAEDERDLLESVRFMDSNECRTVLPAARGAAGQPAAEVLRAIERAMAGFRENVKQKYDRKGEW